MSTRRVLTIERAKWRRGGREGMGEGSTKLLNDEGFMCCLGFDAIACGLQPEQIRGLGEPVQVESPPRGYKRHRVLGGDNTEVVWKAMEINDDADLTDDFREKQIRSLLKRLGWDDVRFV